MGPLRREGPEALQRNRPGLEPSNPHAPYKRRLPAGAGPSPAASRRRYAKVTRLGRRRNAHAAPRLLGNRKGLRVGRGACRGTVVRRCGDRVFGCPEMPGERNRVGADVEGSSVPCGQLGPPVPRRRDTKLKSATGRASPEPVEDMCRRQSSLGTDPQISNPIFCPRA